MITVLVTCVGSGVGQSVIDSLNLKRECFIIGCDGNVNVYAHSFCDKFILVPGLYSEGYTDHILKLCIDNKVDILVPGHDHELVLFARDYAMFKEAGVEVLVSEPNIIAISRDKKEWFDFFAPLGCNIVPTISVAEFLKNPDVSILPAIVKPCGGSASQGITIINELSELKGLKEEDIIQPYLFPEISDKNYNSIVNAVKKGHFTQLSEISIQLVFGKDSKFSGIFISKNSLKNGVPVFVDPINPNEFAYTNEIMKFVPILEQHGVKGPVNIQGRVTPKGLFFFEMNMRFTGITGNRALLGFNEVDYLVHNFLGIDRELNECAYNKVGVRQVACTTIPRQGENKEKDTITILGGGANIGRLFIEKYCHLFKQVNLIARVSSLDKYELLFSGKDNVRVISQEDSAIEQVLCQSDVLLNFVSALAYESDLAKFDAILFLQSMLVKVAKSRIPKIINISSQSVYPQDVNVSKTEGFDVEYKNSYAFQKIIIEEFFKSIKELSPLSHVISLRLPRVIVPNIKGQAGFFSKVIQDYLVGKVVEIDFPENNTNLIHVDDVLDGIVYIMNEISRIQYTSTINLAGNNINLQEYVELVQENFEGKGTFILKDNKEVKTSSMVNGDLIKELGWSPRYTITDIIKQLG